MTLDDETAARIAREVVGGGKASRVYPHSTDVALVQAGYAYRDAEVGGLRAEVEELRADLARFKHDAGDAWATEYTAARQAEATIEKVREYIPRLQTNRARADLRAILDACAPTERETTDDLES